MSQARDGQNYMPDIVETKPVVEPGEFVFAASHFNHGHIYGQIGGLRAAGGCLKYVFDPDPERYRDVLKQNPQCRPVEKFEEILEDGEVLLVTSAAIPNERCGIGLQVMDAGKDYFTDKCPFTTLEQLEQARAKVRVTERKYMVGYSERLLNESAYYAGELVRQGAIGDVLHIINIAPHNLAPETRPAWFFKKEQYGGILTDIGSHQCEQFLHYSGAHDGKVNHARVENFRNPDYPELEDFGEASFTLDTGVSCYCRLDWFNPGGLRTWGDGRTFVMGSKGSIEVRKYINVARDDGGDRIFLVDAEKENEIACKGKVGFPFFGKFIMDILNRTENAMTQEHAFKAAELSLRAQAVADAARAV